MKTYTSTTVTETTATPNRRQSLRQTRTNPTRNAVTTAPPGRTLGESQENVPQVNPGFFPAITHFTDAIAALPKEMTRNYTMLKEVDAKIYAPEEDIRQLLAEIRRAPIPPSKPDPSPQVSSLAASAVVPELHQSEQVGGSSDQIELPEKAQADDQEVGNSADLPRRQAFYNLRRMMNDMLGTLDEKNHVMSTAIDELDKQLERCNSSFPHIKHEVSEEARYGSVNHWAYTTKTAEKKGTLAGERSRRDNAANSHTVPAGLNHDCDGVVSRSEMRREALAARKNRNHPMERDLDEGRSAAQTTNRKAQANGKGKRATETMVALNGVAVGPESGNGPSAAGPPSKRRKIEKVSSGVTTGGLPMERAMSSVYGSNIGSAKGTVASPRDSPAIEVPKKRGRAQGLTNGTTRGRANTTNSNANSPSKASSPVAGTFIVAKDAHRRSPAPLIAQRAQPPRVRQNSAQALQPEARNRPSSSVSVKNVVGNQGLGDLSKASSLTGKSGADIKAMPKEAITSKEEHVVEDINTGDGAGDPRGGMPASRRASDLSFKREETENGTMKTRADRPPSISVSTRGGGGKLSKTSTPLNPSFSDPPSRSQPTRGTGPPIKRSHKKGAGLAAQLAAAAAAANRGEEGGSMQGDDEEDEDGSEPRYCYCQQVSYGEMVACDMETCPREWFHLDCVGLTKAPTKNAKWFCDECKETLKRGKSITTTGSVGNGK